MYIPPEELKPLVPNMGGCVVSNKVMQEKMPIVYMYRDYPDNNLDSGWRMLSGTEDEDYLDDPNNSGFYDLNTIANIDESIIPFLDAQIGAEYERDETGTSFRELKEDE